MNPRVLPRVDHRVVIAADSVTGKVRETNEDALLVAPELALFGVADGMGGLEGGEHASRSAVEVARGHVAAGQRILDAFAQDPTLDHRRATTSLLRQACEEAHLALRAESERREHAMGTTLDLCLLVRDKAFFAHVGDGRAFLVRTRATLQLTEDHLVHDPMSVRAGKLRSAPRPLSSGVGLQVPLRVDVFSVDLHKGDTIVLASDGAYGPLEDEATVAAICRGAPKAIAEQIIRHSLSRGGRDNASVIVLRVEDRLVTRVGDAKREADDLAVARDSALFAGLSSPQVLAALTAAIEVEIEPGHEIPAHDAGDLCAYVVLEGMVRQGTTTLGPPALLYGESLAQVSKPERTVTVVDRARCLRIRCDDFREVAAHDPSLGMELYARLAAHLARLSS